MHKGGLELPDVQRVVEIEAIAVTVTGGAGGGLVQQLVTKSVGNRENYIK